MKCPICKEINLAISERQGIEIDYCPECRGVWLDRGELDKIISKNDTCNNKHEEYKDIRHNEHKDNKNNEYGYNKKKKKESFLGEIFDVFGGD